MDASVYSGAERRMNNSTLVYVGRERRSAWSSRASGDETGLVQRSIARDRQAFARLYDRFVDRVYKYIFLQVGTQIQAEEITGEVFARVWEALPRYRWSERPFAAWLFRIAQNVLADVSRTPSGADVEDILSTPESPDGRFSLSLLRDAISRLPADEQQVIILRFVEGYETDQVAKVLAKSLDQVRALQFHALASMHGMLPGKSDS